MADPGTWQFIVDCQNKAQDGITRMELEILSSWYAIFNEPDLGALGVYDFSVPVMPDVPTFSTSANYVEGKYQPHKDHVWVAAEMVAIQDAIMSALSGGGIGISSALQDSIFNADRDRKLQILSDALLMVDAGSGGRGFRMRGDYLAGQRNEVIQKYQFDMEQLNRDVTRLMEDHARTNWQFCIEKGLSAEQFHADFCNKYDDMFVQMTVAALELYKTKLEADLQAYKAYVEGINLKWDVVKSRISANATALNAEIERMKLELAVATTKTDTQIRSHAAEVTRLASAYKSYSDMVSHYAGTASGIAIVK